VFSSKWPYGSLVGSEDNISAWNNFWY